MSEIRKLQREFKEGQVVHVVASKDTRVATFTTTLIEQDGDTLYVDAISFENKTVGFSVEGIVCCITVDCEPLPIHFVDVDITLCRRNSKFVHKIDVKNNGSGAAPVPPEVHTSSTTHSSAHSSTTFNN